MHAKGILLLLLSLILFTQAEHLGKNENGIDIFKIDLSLEPRERFKETSLHFKKPLHAVLESYLALVPEILVDLVGYIGQALYWLQPEYYQEVDGIAEAVNIDTPSMMFV